MSLSNSVCHATSASKHACILCVPMPFTSSLSHAPTVQAKNAKTPQRRPEPTKQPVHPSPIDTRAGPRSSGFETGRSQSSSRRPWPAARPPPCPFCSSTGACRSAVMMSVGCIKGETQKKLKLQKKKKKKKRKWIRKMVEKILTRPRYPRPSRTSPSPSRSSTSAPRQTCGGTSCTSCSSGPETSWPGRSCSGRPWSGSAGW